MRRTRELKATASIMHGSSLARGRGGLPSPPLPRRRPGWSSIRGAASINIPPSCSLVLEPLTVFLHRRVEDDLVGVGGGRELGGGGEGSPSGGSDGVASRRSASSHWGFRSIPLIGLFLDGGGEGLFTREGAGESPMISQASMTMCEEEEGDSSLPFSKGGSGCPPRGREPTVEVATCLHPVQASPSEASTSPAAPESRTSVDDHPPFPCQ